MSRPSAALSFVVFALSLACGSPEAPAPPAAPPPPGCCLGDPAAPPETNKDACLARGDSWASGPSCEPVCCVIDGKAVATLAGQCGDRQPLADASACAPGAALPPTCCAYKDQIFPASDIACNWDGPPVTYREASDRTGSGRLVAGPQCETVCCEHANFSVETTMRATCLGNVVDRDPCVVEFPATRVCCRVEGMQGMEDVVLIYRWSPDGSCTDGEAPEQRPDADCAGIAYGDDRWGPPAAANPTPAEPTPSERPPSGRPRPTSSVTKTRPR